MRRRAEARRHERDRGQYAGRSPDRSRPPLRAADAGALPPAAATGNYAVNLRCLCQRGRCQRGDRALKQAQLPGFSEQTQINGRPAWRVRIGPMPTTPKPNLCAWKR